MVTADKVLEVKGCSETKFTFAAEDFTLLWCGDKAYLFKL